MNDYYYPLYTRDELTSQYSSFLEDYKTTSSKKAMLTRCLKDIEELLEDITRTLDGKGDLNGNKWLHGKKIRRADYYCVKTEIQVIKYLRKTL